MPILNWVNKAQATISTDAVPYHLLQLKSSHGDDLFPHMGQEQRATLEWLTATWGRLLDEPA